MLQSAIPVVIPLSNVHSMRKGKLQERVSGSCLATNLLISYLTLSLLKQQQPLSACGLNWLVCSQLVEMVCGKAYCRLQAAGVVEASLCGIPAAMEPFWVSSLFRICSNITTYSVLWKAQCRIDVIFIPNHSF